MQWVPDQAFLPAFGIFTCHQCNSRLNRLSRQNCPQCSQHIMRQQQRERLCPVCHPTRSLLLWLVCISAWLFLAISNFSMSDPNELFIIIAATVNVVQPTHTQTPTVRGKRFSGTRWWIVELMSDCRFFISDSCNFAFYQNFVCNFIRFSGITNNHSRIFNSRTDDNSYVWIIPSFELNPII